MKTAKAIILITVLQIMAIEKSHGQLYGLNFDYKSSMQLSANYAAENGFIEQIRSKDKDISKHVAEIEIYSRRLKEIEGKIYDGLAKVDQNVKTAYEVKRMYGKLDDMVGYLSKANKIAVDSEDPMLIAVALKTQAALYRHALTNIDFGSLALKGGESNMLMTSGARLEMMRKMVGKVETLRKSAYRFYITVLTAKRIGGEHYLLPSKIDLNVDTREIAKQTLKEIAGL